jgi:uncharacterized membrane protein YeaQ/YmgE (transglycosylase-associated protein family)
MFAMMIWVALGMLVAIAVRVVLRIKDPDGVVVTVLLGVAGAVLGGLLSVALELADFGERHRPARCISLSSGGTRAESMDGAV